MKQTRLMEMVKSINGQYVKFPCSSQILVHVHNNLSGAKPFLITLQMWMFQDNTIRLWKI